MVGIGTLLSLMKSPVGRYGLVAVAITVALAYGYIKGRSDEYRIGQADVLRAQLAALQRDLTIEQNAATRARREVAAAQSRERTLTERFEQYETELAEGTATPDVCLLGPADVEHLRGLSR